MSFIIEWLIFYVAIMFAMSIDNIFWIPTSPEYKKFKKLPFFKINWNQDEVPILVVELKPYFTKFDYIIRSRIWSVLTHPRDIIPGVITSLILAVVL